MLYWCDEHLHKIITNYHQEPETTFTMLTLTFENWWSWPFEQWCETMKKKYVILYKFNSNMLHTCSLFNRLGIRVINYTIYHGIRKWTLPVHNVIFDVIKPNDTRKITCPLNRVQHKFYQFSFYYHIRMYIDINFSCVVLE